MLKKQGREGKTEEREKNGTRGGFFSSSLVSLLFFRMRSGDWAWDGKDASFFLKKGRMCRDAEEDGIVRDAKKKGAEMIRDRKKPIRQITTKKGGGREKREEKREEEAGKRIQDRETGSQSRREEEEEKKREKLRTCNG